ncbi:MAG: hypothetical protein H0U95_05975 [Bacteroidetes bacterium]|nr:hypothetical protein [Bacteroidota bacterium]
MIKYLVIVFLFFVSLQINAFAGDTLKKKTFYHNIDLSYGLALVPHYTGFITNSIGNDKLSYSQVRTASFNYSYRINPKTTKQNSLFFLGGGINYTDLTAKRQLVDDCSTHSQSGSYNNFYYDNEIINYQIQALRFSIHLEHNYFLRRFIFTQRLGIGYTNFLNKNTVYSYQVHHTFGEETMSPGNPNPVVQSNGWYFDHSDTYSTVDEKMTFLKNNFNPFYAIGLGMKLKQFIPFVNLEGAFLNSISSSNLLRCQAGIKIQF